MVRVARLAKLAHQVNRGLSLNMTPLKIGGPSGATCVQLLVVDHSGSSTHKGMTISEGLRA